LREDRGMKIVISGGSGFIGSRLVPRLKARGDIVVLSRNPGKVKEGRAVEWHPPASGPWTAEVAEADVVVNLAGENIGGGRWTENRKRALESSRIDATSALAAAMNGNAGKKRTFISASAVGFYGDRGDELLDENAEKGAGFLADLTAKWEAAARVAEPLARVVIPRFGVVLEDDGGALAKMLLPFRLGLGGPIGSGRQWMSWIDREDVLRFIEWAIDHEDARGVYNITSPDPVRNRDFVRALGRALHRPAIVPVPGFLLHAIFGQMAEETILGGQRVVPARAMRERFQFAHPGIQETLEHVVKT
jgi:uncharacterized protein (TIGR01777 family)